MAVNIFKDELQHAQMFGKPVLTTNWLIPRETVPDGQRPRSPRRAGGLHQP